MTIDNKIKQLNRQDFVEYLYQLQMFAKEKYSFDVFLENRVSQNGIEEVKKNNLLNNFFDWKNKLPSDLVVNDDEFYN